MRKTLPTYISRLRSSLGDPALVVSRAGGLALDVDPLSVDAIRFERVTSEAIRERTNRIAQLDEALSWWSGPALAGFEHEEWARPHATRLDALHELATDELADALLDVARHEEALPLLESAAARLPLRERTHRLLMLALHRAGRSGEAMRVYQQYRRRLATDLGLDPGEEIRSLERSILSASSRGDDVGAPDADIQTRLHAYELHERIGMGAFSIVYRGVQPSVGREVAIKQIRAELANRPDFIRRFENEAHLVARLEHPHIVPLYDYWREPGSAYLVLRWLRGGSLEAALRDGGLEFGRVLGIVTQVATALSFAHGHGVIHRDVKSANILLDEQGYAYLTDFGIAHDGVITHQPADSISIGSPAYASPEQLRREPVGPPADVHGLGIVLYEVLTGRLPFGDAVDQAALVRRQLNDPLPSVLALRPDLPGGIDAVLARATAKRPADRYASAGEFITELQALAHPDVPVASPRGRTGATTFVPGLDGVNPYKGLRAFDEADAADFFGREQIIRSIGRRLSQPDGGGRFVAVVGPSGSGKSSLVRAALLPALRRGEVAGSEQWFVTTMLPGTNPFDELASALRRVATQEHPGLADLLRADRRGIARGVRRVISDESIELLLVIDQFEELFTQVADETERTRFVEALGDAVTMIGSPLRVVITLRADFYDRPLRYPAIAQLVSDSTITITPLAPDELEMAITQPAHRAGARFEPGLVAEIVADVGSQPGALPLLQYALTELYEGRADGPLALSHYREIGGLAGAIAARAEQLYIGAKSDQQSAVRRLMLRLVTLGEGSEDTRRRVRRAELPEGPATDAVIDAFGTARFLSFDRDPSDREPTVEVAHEALIRQWPRLGEWLTEDRVGLRIHRGLTSAATAWIASDRDDGELLRGARLIATEDWAETHADDLNAVESELLTASIASRDAAFAEEQERYVQQAQQNKRLRQLVVAASVTALVAVVAGLLAFQQRQRASRARRRREPGGVRFRDLAYRFGRRADRGYQPTGSTPSGQRGLQASAGARDPRSTPASAYQDRQPAGLRRRRHPLRSSHLDRRANTRRRPGRGHRYLRRRRQPQAHDHLPRGQGSGGQRRATCRRFAGHPGPHRPQRQRERGGKDPRRRACPGHRVFAN